MIRRLLFKKSINIQRRTYLWNMLSSLFYSFQSTLLLLVITRSAGTTEAGGFILLFTVAQTLNALGNYNLHEFQASDVREEYSFPTYLTTRILTCSLMLILAIAYCFWKKLSTEAAIVMACLIGCRVVECIEDVFCGDVQRAGRLDAASICTTFRTVLSIIAFSIVYILTKSQVEASVVIFAVCIAISFVMIHAVRMEFRERLPISFSKEKILKLLIAGFPVFIGAFMYTYLINVPKYAIADLMDADTQTIYNILFMPAFVINLLSLFIFRPVIVRMSEIWNIGEYRQFRQGIIRQSIIVIGLTAFVILAGDLIGLKMLGWLYGVELAEYRKAFAILLLFGGISALVFFANLILVIIRAQKYMIGEYAFALLISMIVTKPLIIQHGIFGAVLAYGLICISQLLVGYGIILWKMLSSKAWKKTDEK